MNGEKLSELGIEATTVNPTDRIYIVQNLQSKFLTGSTLAAIAGGSQLIVWNPALNELTISGGNTIRLLPPSITISGPEETFIVDDGFLVEKVAIIPTGNQTVTIGTTTGGSEIFSEPLDDGQPMVVEFNFYANGSTILYFNGSNCLVKLYFR